MLPKGNGRTRRKECPSDGSSHSLGGIPGRNSCGTLLRKFVYGPGIDEPIYPMDVAHGNTVYYYHFDGLGSVVALSNVNKTLVERYAYDVFGRPTIRHPNGLPRNESALGNSYLFTGRAYVVTKALVLGGKLLAKGARFSCQRSVGSPIELCAVLDTPKQKRDKSCRKSTLISIALGLGRPHQLVCPATDRRLIAMSHPFAQTVKSVVHLLVAGEYEESRETDIGNQAQCHRDGRCSTTVRPDPSRSTGTGIRGP